MSGTRSQPKSKVQGSCQVSGFRALDIGCVRLLLASAAAAAGSPVQAPCQWREWQPPLPHTCALVLGLEVFSGSKALHI